MSHKNNTNYDILDKILAEADQAGRQTQNGRWVDRGNGQGQWVESKEEFDKLYQAVDDIEKSLRA